MTKNSDASKLLTQVETMIRRAAVKLASQAGGSVDADDLAQVGRETALKALPKFDPEGGACFKTFCWHPVTENMRRAARGSRSLVGRVVRNVARDTLFSAPVNGADSDSAETFGESIADGAVAIDEVLCKAQVEAKVRAIVSKVRAEQTNGALFDDLLERLMTSHFSGKGLRMRSEVSYEDLAAKHGCSRQNIHQRETKIRVALTEALATVAAEF